MMEQRVFTDTSDFCAIQNGDIIRLKDKTFRVFGHAREMRFGIEDPKFWVKRVEDMDTGVRKIVKLAFFETFETKLSGVTIRCFRDPEKEGRVLQLVRGRPYFMQGEVHRDEKGNCVRVIDVVRGTDFLNYLDKFRMPYDVYYRTVLPNVLKPLARAFEAIRYLHANGFRHGDIRNDHIIVDPNTGRFVWIDFDYDFEATENPFALDIFGLGNILIYAIGKGFHDYYTIRNDPDRYPDLDREIGPEDFSLLDKSRMVNIRKIHPIVHQRLNNILMHFSRETDVYYEAVDEMLEDMHRSLQVFE